MCVIWLIAPCIEARIGMVGTVGGGCPRHTRGGLSRPTKVSDRGDRIKQSPATIPYVVLNIPAVVGLSLAGLEAGGFVPTVNSARLHRVRLQTHRRSPRRFSYRAPLRKMKSYVHLFIPPWSTNQSGLAFADDATKIKWPPCLLAAFRRFSRDRRDCTQSHTHTVRTNAKVRLTSPFFKSDTRNPRLPRERSFGKRYVRYYEYCLALRRWGAVS